MKKTSLTDIKIIESSNNKDITSSILPKIISIKFNESLEGEGDSISIELSNNENSHNYWQDDYFTDRNFNLKVNLGLLDCGDFNIDRVEFVDDFDDQKILLEGISAPVQTEPSIYTQIRKVWPLKRIDEILSEMAQIVNIELFFQFFEASKVRTKIQVQNEYIFNVFTRLAEKYGAFTKIFKDENGFYTLLFIGREDLAFDAQTLQNPFDILPGRQSKYILLDKNNPDTLTHSQQKFALISERKELEIVYYDPFKKRTYRKLAKNKTKLFLEKSRKDYEIEKVASKEEADLVAKKVELEPDVEGELRGQFNPNWVSGNIIKVQNYSAIKNGYYLIKASSHKFTTNGLNSSCRFEKLPSIE